jgi:glycine/D-amino acid oxidase-like deaminating enzyme
MKIAIIGAGFAGLATAYFLTEFEGIKITLFDKAHIGAGASGAASGLLHPYPGIMARRSQRAEEALQVSKYLLNVAEAHTQNMVYNQTGIYRISISQQQHERLLSHADIYGDVELVEKNRFLIRSGITVLSTNYLDGLANAVEERGVKIRMKGIETLKQLNDSDHIIIAAGYGIQTFKECAHLKVKFLKGQALQIAGVPDSDKSLISKGYLANLGTQHHFDIGSTYERSFRDDLPDFSLAKELLADKLKPYRNREILGCKSGIRVCPQNHYLPMIENIAPNATVFTALGSRGLLYHGLFGRSLANEIAQNALMS